MRAGKTVPIWVAGALLLATSMALTGCAANAYNGTWIALGQDRQGWENSPDQRTDPPVARLVRVYRHGRLEWALPTWAPSQNTERSPSHGQMVVVP